jgi:histidinol-phosphate aminotransferase
MKLAEVDQLVGGPRQLVDEHPGALGGLLAPFRPGPQYASADGWIRLSLSESSYGCSPLVSEAVAQELPRLHRYPDPGAGALVARLAETHGLTEDHFVVGNGVDELLLLAAIAFGSPAGIAVVSDSTYPGHANAVAVALRQPSHHVPAGILRVDVAAVIDQMSGGALVFICNPHNPFGTALTAAEIDALVLAAAARGAVIVFDEAYIEYTMPGETHTAMDHVRDGGPVIVLRTFSKIYGLAGLRCGYAAADPALCDELRRTKNVLVFNVNRMALTAAEAALADPGFYENVRTQTRAGLTAFQDWLASEPWASTERSVTNFALVEMPWPAAIVAAELAHRCVLVRDCTDMGLPLHIRISVGLPHEMEAIGSALRHVAAQLSGTRPMRTGTNR